MSEDNPATQTPTTVPGSARSAEARPLVDVPAVDELAWAMVDASPDALVMVNDGIIELVSCQTEELFGYDRGELLGRPVEVLIPERFASVHRAHRTRYRAAPAVRAMGTQMELLARRSDGVEFPVEISLSPLEIGGELRVIAAVRDISVRVEAETAARRTRRGIDSIADGVFMADPETLQFVYVNQGAVDQCGFSAEELQGMTLLHFTPDFAPAELNGLFRQLRDGAVPQLRFETTLRPRSGRDFPVEAIIDHPEVDAEHRQLFVIVVRDITDRVAVERAHLRLEQLNAAVSGVRLAMLQGASRHQGLTMVCRAVVASLEAEAAVIVTPTGNDDLLAIEAAVNLPHHVRERLEFRRSQGGVGAVMRSGQPEVTDNPAWADMPASNREVIDELVGSLLLAPLTVDDDVIGVLAVTRGHDRAPFTADDLGPVTQFASSAANAIELARARDDRSQLEVFEDRERMGRDLHDKVISRLFATGMSIQGAAGRTGDPDVADRLDLAVGEIDEAIKEIRTAIYGLRSRRDWGHGVRGQILAVAADHHQSLGFEPSVSFQGPIDDLPPTAVDDLLATIREALTNAAKYAGATTMTIDVRRSATTLTLGIEDDGTGFDPGSTGHGSEAGHPDHGGHGLANMVARAEANGGTATITSEPGRGTSLAWTIELDL